MNNLKVLKFLFSMALLLHTVTFFIFNSWVGPAIAFSLATLTLFPGKLGKLGDGASRIVFLLGKVILFSLLVPCYFLLLAPLRLFYRGGRKRDSTLVACERREVTPDFFRRQW